MKPQADEHGAMKTFLFYSLLFLSVVSPLCGIVAAEEATDSSRMPKVINLLTGHDDTPESISGDPELDTAIEQTSATALREVHEGLVFPESYGRTTVIDGSMQPFRLPEGPMERLVRKPVTIHMVNANLAELLLALGKLDGLNLIADESLATTTTLTLHVTDVPLHEIFSYVARNMGVDFHVGANTVWVTAAPGGKTPEGMPLTTRIYSLHHGFPPRAESGGGDEGGNLLAPSSSSDPETNDLLNAISVFLDETTSPEGAKYAFYPNQNVLVVRDTRENLRLVEELITVLDRPPLQVLIETRFIRISQEDLAQLGVDVESFSFNQDPDQAISRLNLIGSSTFANDITDGGQLGLSGIITRKQYEVVIRALESKSSTKTLSAPRITVLNNHKAKLDDSRKEYYFGEYDLEAIDQGDEGTATRLVPVGAPEELEIGILMEVVPSVGNDSRTITLTLAPKITGSDEPFGVRNLRSEGVTEGKETTTVYNEGFIQVPSYYENSVTTTVTVNSGQTVLLGGSMSTQERTVVDKTPILGDLPLVGWIFRSEEKRSDPENLLIFVTATVIAPDGTFIRSEPSAP
jgi:type IV pilus assembly protein PilQ